MRRLVPLLVVLAALAAPSAAAAAPEAGLNVNGGVSVTRADIDALAATGAKWSRHFVFEDAVDDAGLAQLRDSITYAGTKGIKSIVVVARSDRRPTSAGAFAERMGRIATAMAGQVEAYEVWNEEDEAGWWNAPGGPNAANYLDMLRASYAAVKRADPLATVILGPLTANNYGFLEQMYAANGGAALPADAVAVHTDTACLTVAPSFYYRDSTQNGRIGRYSFLGIKEVRNTLVKAGDPKPVWVTEFGWQASNRTCSAGTNAGNKPEGVSEAQQAQYLAEALHCLSAEDYVPVALWYTDRDPGYGLYEHPRALDAFKRYAASGDQLTGPCGDFVAPELEVLSPQPGQKFAYKSKIPIVVRTKGGDTRSILVDAKAAAGTGRIGGFSNPPSVPNDYTTVAPMDFAAGKPCKDACRLDWSGFVKPAGGSLQRVSPGGATIVVSASDAPGNVATKEIPIQIVPPGQLPAAKATFAPLKVLGKGRARKVRVLIKPAAKGSLSPVKGGVFVEWQNFRRGRWKKIHGGGKSVRNVKDVNIPTTFSQRLKYGGRWRVRAVYKGRAPYGPVKSRWVSFRA